jgi:hypothetical protein
MSYKSVSLLDTQNNFKVIWTASGPLSSETIIGLLVGLKAMINKNYSRLSPVLEIVHSVGKIFTIDIIADHIPILNNYIEYNAIPYNYLTEYYAPPGYYGWWIKNPSDNLYNLYKFQSNDFIQGFISAFNIFNIEFRDYIAGPPFHTEISSDGIKTNIFYNIEGYDIQSLVKVRRVPAPVGAFYTNSYEQYNLTGNEPDHITDEIYSEYPRDFQ